VWREAAGWHTHYSYRLTDQREQKGQQTSERGEIGGRDLHDRHRYVYRNTTHKFTKRPFGLKAGLNAISLTVDTERFDGTLCSGPIYSAREKAAGWHTHNT
jgi:hypothetical protein